MSNDREVIPKRLNTISEIQDKIFAVAQGTLGDFIFIRNIGYEYEQGEKYQEYVLHYEEDDIEQDYPRWCVYDWKKKNAPVDAFGGLLIVHEQMQNAKRLQDQFIRENIDYIVPSYNVDLLLPISYVVSTLKLKPVNMYNYPKDLLEEIYNSKIHYMGTYYEAERIR